ncbi:MAG: hypothetical protein PHV13_01235 [Candidatus ainarchaeum sp.]|nr:hypothetical protein [Candidatus ainarchaeum sp.]
MTTANRRYINRHWIVSELSAMHQAMRDSKAKFPTAKKKTLELLRFFEQDTFSESRATVIEKIAAGKKVITSDIAATEKQLRTQLKSASTTATIDEKPIRLHDKILSYGIRMAAPLASIAAIGAFIVNVEKIFNWFNTFSATRMAIGTGITVIVGCACLAGISIGIEKIIERATSAHKTVSKMLADCTHHLGNTRDSFEAIEEAINPSIE